MVRTMIDILICLFWCFFSSSIAISFVCP